ncbi:hypothetical protein [Lysobacter tyrosinilyticus]
MHRIVRPIAIFALLYLTFGSIFYIGLPRLIEWHFANCATSTAVCSLSSTFLSYWWLALLPVLVIVTLLINRVFARRHAA